jgi:hypothetical protein
MAQTANKKRALDAVVRRVPFWGNLTGFISPRMMEGISFLFMKAVICSKFEMKTLSGWVYFITKYFRHIYGKPRKLKNAIEMAMFREKFP